jgi:hypothetical protein
MQKSPAVRQEWRKPLARFMPLGLDLGDPRGNATASGHAIKAILSREQNQAVPVPGAPGRTGDFDFA